MDSRTRVLTALDGESPDRIPCALAFYPVDISSLLQPEEDVKGNVDVAFVRVNPPQVVEVWQQTARITPDDTRIGTFAQVDNYDRWSYKPQTPDQRNPLACAKSLQELRSFVFPEIDLGDQIASISRQVVEYHNRGMAVGCNLPHLGGELFEAAWRLRGLENFLLDLIERPAWAHLLLDRLTEMACRYAAAVALADVDIMALGDDIGMPGTMMMSPKCWQTFFKPRMAQIIRTARAIKPDIRVIFHSDGYYTPIIPDLLDIGVNGINPLQAEHMDAEKIRKRFGPKLAFWGTVGSQTTFSFASPEEIKFEVKHRIDTLGSAGLILCPAYDIDEPDISWVNIAAFLEAVYIYGNMSNTQPPC
jgi:uroporphyrinogen decarboxylase